MVIHADTSYLVDLLREQARGRDGDATLFLERHASDKLMASVFVACELEAGAARAAAADRERARLQTLLQAMTIVYPDDRFAPTCGQLLATLQRAGTTVATMDLLIATTAVVDQAALVTANRRHFEKIPGLDVVAY